jgi:hypothetical protein
MGLLCGRAGRLTALVGDFRPGQLFDAVLDLALSSTQPIAVRARGMACVANALAGCEPNGALLLARLRDAGGGGAAAAAGEGQKGTKVVQFAVPEGAAPGQQLALQVGDQKVHVVVPEGVAPGTQLQVEVPVAEEAGEGGAAAAKQAKQDGLVSLLLRMLESDDPTEQRGLALIQQAFFVGSGGAQQAVLRQIQPAQPSSTSALEDADAASALLGGLAEYGPKLLQALVAWPATGDGANTWHCASILSTFVTSAAGSATLPQDKEALNTAIVAAAGQAGAAGATDALMSRCMRTLAAIASRPVDLSERAGAMCGILVFLGLWSHDCRPAISCLLQSAQHIETLVQLCADRSQAHIAGLAAFLLAICLDSSYGSRGVSEPEPAADKQAVMSIVEQIGRQEFSECLDLVLSSKAFRVCAESSKLPWQPCGLPDESQSLQTPRYTKDFVGMFRAVTGRVQQLLLNAYTSQAAVNDSPDILESVQMQSEEYTTLIRSYDSELAEHKAELAAHRGKNAELETQNAELQQLRPTLAQTEAQCSELEAQLAEAAAQAAAAAEAEADGMADRLRLLEAELAAAKLEAAAAKEAAANSAVSSEHLAELEEARAMVAALEEERSHAKIGLQAAESKCAELEAQISVVQQPLGTEGELGEADIAAAHGAMEAQLQVLETELADAKREAAAASESVASEHLAELVKAKETVAALEQERSEAAGGLEEAVEVNEGLMRQVEAQRAEDAEAHGRLQATIERQERALASGSERQTEFVAAQQLAARWEDEHRAAHAELTAHKATLSEAAARIDGLQEERAAAGSATDQQAVVETLGEELAELRRAAVEWSDSRAEAERAARTATSMAAELAQAREVAAASEQAMQARHETVETLQREVGQLRQVATEWAESKGAVERAALDAAEETQRQYDTAVEGHRQALAQVRKTPSWPRSWANFSLL